MKRLIFAILLLLLLVQPIAADYPIILFGETDRIYIGAPQTVTPTYGDELVTNGSMETGDPPTGWTLGNNAILSSVADERTGGSGTQSMNIVRNGTNSPYASQSPSLTVGRFINFSGWVKNIDAALGVRIGIRNSGGYFIGVVQETSTTWKFLDYAALVSSNASISLRIIADATANPESARFDDISLREIVTSSMFGDVRTAAASGTFVTDWPTSPTNGHRVGLIICLDDESNPQNFIMASLDGTNAYLSKWVGGTWTNLISSASAFAAGNLLQIVKDGNSVQLWHKGVQVGTTQTISDAGVTSNVKMAWFTTNGSLKPTYLQWVR